MLETFATRAPSEWEPALNEEHDAHRWATLEEALALLRWAQTKEALQELARRLTMTA